MNNVRNYRRFIGVSLVVFFVICSEMVIYFNNYIFGFLGLDRFWTLLLLWILPAAASYISVSRSSDKEYMWVLTLIALVSCLGTATHFFAGEFGSRIDFGGVAGARVVFELYLGLGALSVGVGYCVAKINKSAQKS